MGEILLSGNGKEYALDIIIGRKVQAPDREHWICLIYVDRCYHPGRDVNFAIEGSWFGVIHRLQLYNSDELMRIIIRSAGILGIPIDAEGAPEIADRSRGTPRVANRLLKRVRDFAQIKADGVITLEVAREALDLLQVDSVGLDEIDGKILMTIIKKYNGGPVGLDTLAASTGEEKYRNRGCTEPFLATAGFIACTPRGRGVTSLAYRHLRIPYQEQEKLI